MLYDRPIYYNTLFNDMNAFYKDLNKANFNKLTQKRLIELKAHSLKLNIFLHNKHSDLNRPERYVRIMNNIKRSPEKYGIDINNYYAEMYILFMFGVDPDFEAKIICEECNRINELKQRIEIYFGIYDINLIKLENFYLKNFATEKKREKIKEKIIKRVFK